MWGPARPDRALLKEVAQRLEPDEALERQSAHRDSAFRGVHPVAVPVLAVRAEWLNVHGPALLHRMTVHLCQWQVRGRRHGLAGMPERWLLLDRDAVEHGP